MIREAKRGSEFQKTGGTPSSKAIYQTLKTHHNPGSSVAADEPNSFFSTFAEKKLEIFQETHINLQLGKLKKQWS